MPSNIISHRRGQVVTHEDYPGPSGILRGSKWKTEPAIARVGVGNAYNASRAINDDPGVDGDNSCGWMGNVSQSWDYEEHYTWCLRAEIEKIEGKVGRKRKSLFTSSRAIIGVVGD